MPILNNAISASGSGSSTDNNMARFLAVEQTISGIFSAINNILSDDGFTRVDQNDTGYNSDTGNWHFRETYKLGDNDKKYLIVDLSNMVSLGSGDNYDKVTIGLLIFDQIVSTSSSAGSATYNYATATIMATSTRSSVTKDNTTTYSCDISFSGYLLNVKNESLSLYTPSASTNKTVFNSSVGRCVAGEKEYMAWSSSSSASKYLMLQNADGNIKYTYSVMLTSYAGTSDAGYILTLPIYLATGISTSSVIDKDAKLENTLQTTNTSCAYGSVYKIGGVDYFAIGNNFLIKL